jgi:thioredoxin 1
MLTDRLIILFAFAIVLALITVGTRLWVRSRDRRRQQASDAPLWEALETEPDGRPTIVAFSTPSCGVCRTAQAPALNALIDRLGPSSVRIIHVDAAERPRVADAFGVLTVPTTVVLANSGHVATTNNGFAPLDRLAQQVQLAASF